MMTGTADRTVIVHGTADVTLAAALGSAGLVPVLERGATTVWSSAPLPAQDVTPAHTSGPEPEAAPLLLTIPEAAALLGVGRTTAYQLISAGELEVVHVGRCARVPAGAVADFVEALRN